MNTTPLAINGLVRLFIQPGRGSGNLQANISLIQQLLSEGVPINEIEVVWIRQRIVPPFSMVKAPVFLDLTQLESSKTSNIAPKVNDPKESLEGEEDEDEDVTDYDLSEDPEWKPAYDFIKKLQASLSTPLHSIQPIQISFWSADDYLRANQDALYAGQIIAKGREPRQAMLGCSATYDDSHFDAMRAINTPHERRCTRFLQESVPMWKDAVFTGTDVKGEVIQLPLDAHEYQPTNPALNVGYVTGLQEQFDKTKPLVGFYGFLGDRETGDETMQKIVHSLTDDRTAFNTFEWGTTEPHGATMTCARVDQPTLGWLYAKMDLVVCEGQNTANDCLRLGIPVVHIPADWARTIYPNDDWIKTNCEGDALAIIETISLLKTMGECCKTGGDPSSLIHQFTGNIAYKNNLKKLADYIDHAPSIRTVLHDGVLQDIKKSSPEASAIHSVNIPLELKKQMDAFRKPSEAGKRPMFRNTTGPRSSQEPVKKEEEASVKRESTKNKQG